QYRYLQPHKRRNKGRFAIPQLPRRSRSQNLAENQAQVERADVNQLSLQNVLSPAQVCSSHSAGFVAVGKGPLYQLSALLQPVLAVSPLPPPPVRVHRLLFLRLALPPPSAMSGFRYVCSHRGLTQHHHRASAVVSLVRDYLGDSVDVNLWFRFRPLFRFPLDQLRDRLTGLSQRFMNGGGVSLIRRLQRHCDYRATLHVYSMLRLMGHVRAAILHLRDAGIRIGCTLPLLVRSLLLPLAIEARQVFPSRRLDPAFLG